MELLAASLLSSTGGLAYAIAVKVNGGGSLI